MIPRVRRRASTFNFAASASLDRASSPTSFPTATTAQPCASQCRASAQLGKNSRDLARLANSLNGILDGSANVRMTVVAEMTERCGGRWDR
jgi:hypothetical protein